jgi:DNA-binding CsgD family transcriptional regulator/PAS domain-containing protein
MKIAQLSAVRARLGEATLDPAQWRGLLEEMCRVVGASGASLRQNGVRTTDVPYTRSMEELTAQYFREGWQARDTRLRKLQSIHLRAPVFHDFHVFGNDELRTLSRTDPFFNDFLGKGNLKWSAWIQFRSGKSPWLIGFQRNEREGQFEQHEISMLQPLYRSLEEAAALSDAISKSVLSGVMDAFDSIEKPAIAFDRTGRVIRANSAACGVFDEDIRVRNGRLVLSDSKAKQRLEHLFEAVSALEDIEPIAAHPILVTSGHKRPRVFRLLSVPAAARSPFLGARTILTISEPRKGQTLSPDLLRLFLDLNPAQARLASHLASGGSLDEASTTLQLSRETLRSQLKVLFAKTRTKRQGELIAMLHRLGAR